MRSLSHPWAVLGTAAVMSAACASTGSAGAGGTTGGGSSRVPKKVVFQLDALQLVKEGEQITETQVRNLFSTMPMPRGTPREPSVLSEQPLEAEAFEAIWAVLAAFDFEPYRKLAAPDFVDLLGPTDTSYSSSLYLAVDGVEKIRISLPMGPPKDAALRSRLDMLREDIDRPMRAAKAKRALAGVGTPQSLGFQLGRTYFEKEPERTILKRYCLFPPDSEWLERARPALERSAKANPDRLEVTQSTVQVTLDEADFMELWQALSKVDFVRIAGLGREGFIFRPQSTTPALSLSIDGRSVVSLQQSDRELNPAEAAPLVPIEKVLDAKLKQKLDSLTRRQVPTTGPL